jgi:sterol desaturase/sphingolipid hydroxylase (fatty acid hydroxylase superfamily)
LEWLPFFAFILGFFLLAGAELLWPIHHRPRETKGRLFVNFGLGVIDAAMVALLPLSTVLAALWAQQQKLGLLNLAELPSILEFALAIIALSLGGYVLHRLEHRNPLLWRFHRIHHGDTAVDISTGFRGHPFARLMVAAWMAATTIILGLSVPAVAFYQVAAGVYPLWTHANLRVPAGAERLLRWLLVTPQMHHVHHSATRRETDSNYGDVFSIWDRLFGTYRNLGSEELAAVRFGLGDAYDGGAGSLVQQLRLPLLNPSVPAAQPAVTRSTPAVDAG